MGHKRKPSFHQKQIRFLAFFIGAIMVAVVIGLMWFFNTHDTHPTAGH